MFNVLQEKMYFVYTLKYGLHSQMYPYPIQIISRHVCIAIYIIYYLFY